MLSRQFQRCSCSSGETTVPTQILHFHISVDICNDTSLFMHVMPLIAQGLNYACLIELPSYELTGILHKIK